MSNADVSPPTPDFRRIFEAMPGAYIVLSPDYTIVAVSDAYARATMTNRADLLGRALFEVFPENPDEPAAAGMRDIRESLDRVRHNHLPDTIPLQRYDIQRPAAEGGGFTARYWSLISSPVFGPNHELLYIIHRVDDVTEYVRLKQQENGTQEVATRLQARTTLMEAEIYGRAQEAQARQAAEAQRARLYHLFTQIPAAICVLRGPHYVFELANQSYHQLVGADRPLEGHTLLEALPEVAPEIRTILHRVYTTGERFVGEEYPVNLDWDYNGRPYVKYLNFVYAPLRDTSAAVDGILAFAYDVTDQVLARQRLALLAEVSATLTSLLDYETTLRSVAQLAVPALADFCFFDVVREGEIIERVAWAHNDPAQQAYFDQVWLYTPPETSANHPVARVISGGVTEFVPEVDDAWLQQIAISDEHLQFIRDLNFHAIMFVPVVARERKIGALTLALVNPYRHYTAADRELAEELARRAALAIENARLYAAEQRQRADAERRLAVLAAVINSIPDAVYIGNAGGITMCNQPALSMLGFDSLDELNHDVSFLAEQLHNRDAFTGQRLSVEEEAFSTALRGQPKVNEVIVRHRQTGEDRIVRSAAAPIRHNGQILGAVAVNSDITERRQEEIERLHLLERERAARAEAEAAVRMRDEFLSVAAHELKTPVTSMRGYAQLLGRQIGPGRTPSPERVQRSVDAIVQQSDKLARFIDQLLDVSRIAAGRLSLNPQPTDMGQLVREIVESMQAMTTQHVLELVVTGDTQTHVDALRFEQVMTNLITNAIKYSPYGGPVWIDVERRNRTTIRISVTDRGIGIPAEHRGRIFERFYQAHGSGYFGGMGLGLSISKAIVEAHGGQLEAEFPDEGGTRLVILLPVAPDMH
ncbi:MAG: PAS domain-containing protein [Chloroflexi bacterium]|nr:PAS domain-containing protein [Chloroflexota bacterium]